MLLADSQNTSASFYCRQTTEDDLLNNKRSRYNCNDYSQPFK